MQSDKQTGFSLLGVVVVVAAIVLIAFAISIFIKPSTNQKIVNNFANSVTPTTAGIGVSYTGSLSGAGSTNATMTGPTWLSLDMLSNLTGTPGGNDFGENVFTLTHTDQNGTTYTADFTITVPNPTGTFTPPTALETTPVVGGGGESGVLDINIKPPPNAGTPYAVEYKKVILRDKSPLKKINQDTSDNAGDLTLQVYATFDWDYEDEIYIIIKSNNPGVDPVEIGPVISKPEP